MPQEVCKVKNACQWIKLGQILIPIDDKHYILVVIKKASNAQSSVCSVACLHYLVETLIIRCLAAALLDWIV